ncbi:MAG TPA: hypothetical protein VM070_04460 [Candidatus Saccharimonadales bacterium]|nr:hypothetical protein [Candidatus Saccharimonadales bacterium]
MIASQAIRSAPARPAPARRGAHAVRRRPIATVKAPRSTRPARATAGPQAADRTSWDLRLFGAAAAAIVIGFALAVLYLSQATAVSATGYEAQRLAAARDELRRQNALAEVQIATLESPARIATAAARLGMTRAAYVPVIAAAPLRAETR